jgi:hypothetical protein
MEPRFAPQPTWAKTLAFNARLDKTELCEIFMRLGFCSNDCSFAHSRQELRERPRLEKTSKCKLFERGRCRDPRCKFAHGDKELRCGFLYKTQICSWYECGRCTKGALCLHAHGEDELRAPQRLAWEGKGIDAAPAKVCLSEGVAYETSSERCYAEV